MRPKGRDDEAFTESAAVLTPRLFRTALLLCDDWHLAEDLVQTTLAKLYVGGALTKTFLSHVRLRRNPESPTVDLGQGRRTAAT